MKVLKNLIFYTLFWAVAMIKAIPLLLSDYYMLWQAWVPVLLWVVGGFFGNLALLLDRLVDVLFGNPSTPLAQTVKEIFNKGKYLEGWRILGKNKDQQTRLVFRSALFQIVWVFLALFTVTSTTSLFGKGFVLGIGLHLLLDEWSDYFADRQYLKKWLFWQINREIKDTELKNYLLAMTVLTGIFFLLVIF